MQILCLKLVQCTQESAVKHRHKWDLNFPVHFPDAEVAVKWPRTLTTDAFKKLVTQKLLHLNFIFHRAWRNAFCAGQNMTFSLGLLQRNFYVLLRGTTTIYESLTPSTRRMAQGKLKSPPQIIWKVIRTIKDKRRGTYSVRNVLTGSSLKSSHKTKKYSCSHRGLGTLCDPLGLYLAFWWIRKKVMQKYCQPVYRWNQNTRPQNEVLKAMNSCLLSRIHSQYTYVLTFNDYFGDVLISFLRLVQCNWPRTTNESPPWFA